MTINFSIVDVLRAYRPLIIPHCDVITNVPQPADDRYRNATRFFTSAPRPPPSSSRDHTGDDVKESRDPGDPAATPYDVMTSTTFQLVLVVLDVLVLLYRVTHVCRVVNRSRDCRKYYYDDDVDDDDQCWTSRQDASRQDHVDETLYQLTASSSSSSSWLTESTVVCRLVRSSYVSKLVMFAALVTSSHVTLRMIDSFHAPAAIDLMTLAHNSSTLSPIDSDVEALHDTQRQQATTQLNAFVVDALSNLSFMIQLINNRNLISLLSPFHSSLLPVCMRQMYRKINHFPYHSSVHLHRRFME